MNINNLYEAVPVEKELPDLNYENRPVTFIERSSGAKKTTLYSLSRPIALYQKLYSHWLRPVTREILEEWLREFGEKVWDISEAYNSNIDEDIPDKQTAITELINKTLGQ